MSVRCAPSREWATYPNQIERFTERLRSVILECQPALDLIRSIDDPCVLLYVDPPYVPETRGRRNQYRHDMDEDDHQELLEVLVSAKSKVVLSGYPCALYESHLTGWARYCKVAFADGARPREEVLWCNEAATNARRQGSLFQ